MPSMSVVVYSVCTVSQDTAAINANNSAVSNASPTASTPKPGSNRPVKGSLSIYEKYRYKLVPTHNDTASMRHCMAFDNVVLLKLKLNCITRNSNVLIKQKNRAVLRVVPYDPKNAIGALRSFRTTGD